MGNFGELIDPQLEKRYVEIELFRMIEAAAACVRHSAAKRPRMALVVRALDFEGDPDLSNGINSDRALHMIPASTVKKLPSSGGWNSAVTTVRIMICMVMITFLRNHQVHSRVPGSPGIVPVNPKLKHLNHHQVAAIVMAQGTMAVVASDKCLLPELFTLPLVPTTSSRKLVKRAAW